MAESSQTTTLKLMISKKTNKVLFAEAKKDLVDFLFHVLSFPVGSISKLLTDGGKNDTISPLANLYQSLGDLNKSEHLVSGLIDKTTVSLLKPSSTSTTATSSVSELPRLHFPTSTGLLKKYFKCSSSVQPHCYGFYVSDFAGAKCPYCKHNMDTEVKLVQSSSVVMNEDGYVKGVTTYMVMDDLRVLPSSGISGISLLKDFGVFDFSSIEERVVSVGFEQGVSLLKALLQSQTVLTDVFLGEKAIKQERND